MSDRLAGILKALEKPLRFAAKNDFARINMVKDVDVVVGDLTLKALSLPLTEAQAGIVTLLRDTFQGYGSLGPEGKREAVKRALGYIERINLLQPPEAEKDAPPEGAGAPPPSPGDSSRERGSVSGDPFDIPVQYVKGVGPRIAALLGKRGIKSVGDALYYFPRRYEDRRVIKKISQVEPGEAGDRNGGDIGGREG